MRIFLAVRHSRDPRLFFGDLWSRNFVPALEEQGHEVVESKVDLLPASRFMDIAADFTPEELKVRAETTEKILAELRAAYPVDLFLSYFYSAHFDPDGFEALRALAVPSVNFYCNSLYQFDHVRSIAAKADFSWHAERDARALYLAAGARPVWVQMGADPSLYRPIERAARMPRVCFIGQRYADRDRWASSLIDAGAPLDLYGKGWGPKSEGEKPHHQEAVGRRRPAAGSFASRLRAAREELVEGGLFRGGRRILERIAFGRRSRALDEKLSLFARGPAESVAETLSHYELCLNFSNVWADGRPGSPLITHLRLRDFEAPMCRASYLTGYSEEIEEFYAIGKEIDTYRSKEELADKIRFYLANPFAAERLREAGYRRARSDHTWAQRFRKLFAAIGLSAAAAL